MNDTDEIARLRALWCEEKSKAMTFHAEVERLRAEVAQRTAERDEAIEEFAAAIRALLAELAQRTAERDEARRLYCHAQARIPDGRPEQLAQTLGWDCFKEVL
jgi:predicted ATPase